MALMHVFYGMSILALLAIIAMKIIGYREARMVSVYEIGLFLLSAVYFILYSVVVIGYLSFFSIFWLLEL